MHVNHIHRKKTYNAKTSCGWLELVNKHSASQISSSALRLCATPPICYIVYQRIQYKLVSFGSSRHWNVCSCQSLVKATVRTTRRMIQVCHGRFLPLPILHQRPRWLARYLIQARPIAPAISEKSCGPNACRRVVKYLCDLLTSDDPSSI